MRIFLYLFVLVLFSACAALPPPFNRIKKLDLSSIQKIEKEQILGTYSWSMRGHSSTIELKENGVFVNDINNSFYRGYQKGHYAIIDSSIVLNSDSLIYQKWSDILYEINITHRKIDTSSTEFIVTNLGLHEKQYDGPYYETPSYVKK